MLNLIFKLYIKLLINFITHQIPCIKGNDHTRKYYSDVHKEGHVFRNAHRDPNQD